MERGPYELIRCLSLLGEQVDVERKIYFQRPWRYWIVMLSGFSVIKEQRRVGDTTVAMVMEGQLDLSLQSARCLCIRVMAGRLHLCHQHEYG